jgi:hypothetical protein
MSWKQMAWHYSDAGPLNVQRENQSTFQEQQGPGTLI